MTAASVLKRLATDWAAPKHATHWGQKTSMPLVCTLEEAPSSRLQSFQVPPELAALWQEVQSARLFEDKNYGQWGLILYEPKEVETATATFRRQRARDFAEGDLVIGEFLGDSDLLVIRCDPQESDYGGIIVALPLDPRSDWYSVAGNFEAFLEEYERAEGAKFWEEP